MLDILVLTALAIFFVSRLRNVLGKHIDDSQVKKRKDKRQPGAKVQPLYPAEDVVSEDELEPESDALLIDEIGDPAVTKGLMAIKEADPSFNVKEFINGSRMAFEMIVEAYAKGDKVQLRELLSREVMEDFESAIDARKTAKTREETTLVAIKSCEIIDAELKGRSAEVTVQFVSEQITVERDAEGKIVGGDPSDTVEVTDEWTFARNVNSPNPNWELVAS